MTTPPSGGFAPDAHPDIDRLADLEAGLLDDPALARHVESCPACGHVLASVAAVRADLGGLPTVTMPPDVADRIDAALAETRASGGGTGTVLPMDEHPRRRWRDRFGSGSLAGAAAVVVLLALGVGVVINHAVGGGGGEPGGGAPTSLAAPHGIAGPLTVTTSGRNYTAHNLSSAVPALLAQSHRLTVSGSVAGVGSQAGDSTAPSVGTTGGTTGDTAPPLEGAPAQAPHPASHSGALFDRAAKSFRSNQTNVRRCLAGLQEPAAPLAIDVGTYQGKPAAVFVFPSENHPNQVDVYIYKIPTNCSPYAIPQFFRVDRS